jgi:GNAT superfamily N-acetyltransferase
MTDQLRIVPANEATDDEVQAIFGRGDAVRCQCQWFRWSAAEHRASSPDERAARLREQAGFGSPDAETTTGLVAYLGDEPVGWCAVAPRSTYVRLRASRLVWSDRQEDPDDESVWTVSCFVTRTGYRRRGISAALARAAVDFARERGAKAVEGYPIVTEDKDVGSAELFVGSSSTLADAGFVEITRPTDRRAVMRVDF